VIEGVGESRGKTSTLKTKETKYREGNIVMCEREKSRASKSNTRAPENQKGVSDHEKESAQSEKRNKRKSSRQKK